MGCLEEYEDCLAEEWRRSARTWEFGGALMVRRSGLQRYREMAGICEIPPRLISMVSEAS
jgi:hypothetical protein